MLNLLFQVQLDHMMLTCSSADHCHQHASVLVEVFVGFCELRRVTQQTCVCQARLDRCVFWLSARRSRVIILRGTFVVIGELCQHSVPVAVLLGGLQLLGKESWILPAVAGIGGGFPRGEREQSEPGFFSV